MARHGDANQDRPAGGPLLRATGPWRRWLLPIVVLAAFAAMNAFWAHLGTGRWWDFSPGAYARDLGVPLQETYLAPLSVLSHPWMIVIHGLLLGTAALVPILVATLHRWVLAAAFVLVVGGVGHAPVLAAVLLVGCVLVVQTPLRRPIPFLAALLGMLPVGIYLFLSALIGSGVETVLPIQRWELRAPLVLAAVSGVSGAIIVLAVAYWTGFRPIGAWGLLAAIPWVPVVLFYMAVGPAERDYQWIAHGLGSGDEIFPSVPRAAWIADVKAEGLTGKALRDRARGDLEERRGDLIDRCEAYLRTYPRGDRAAEVAWLAAHCAGLELNEPAFDAGTVRYATIHTPPEARGRWRKLAENYSGAPHAALAIWHEGQADLRAGQMDRADGLLQTAVERLDKIVHDGNQPAARRSGAVFSPPRTLPGPRYYRRALLSARRDRWLMKQNNVLQDPNSAAALAAYLETNPLAMTSQKYLDRLKTLAGKYEATALGENLKLEVAKATPDLAPRLAQLILLAEQRDDLDAAVEANYELGKLVLHRPHLQKRKDVRAPRAYFRAVEAAPPSPWTPIAAERLQFPPPATQPGRAPR